MRYEAVDISELGWLMRKILPIIHEYNSSARA